MSQNLLNTFDVVVVGAGPAGAMAAIEAVRSGLSVAIIKKTVLPRRKVCAGGLVKRAVSLIPKEISFPIEQQCHSITLSVDDANIDFTQQRQNLVTMVCRSAFDMALIQYAKSLGVQLFDESSVTNISPMPTHINIQTNLANFQAKYLVFAEGATARLSNQFWADERLLLPSLEADVYVSPEQHDSLKHSAIFDFGVFTGGYGWIFPKCGHFSICQVPSVCRPSSYLPHLEA